MKRIWLVAFFSLMTACGLGSVDGGVTDGAPNDALGDNELDWLEVDAGALKFSGVPVGETSQPMPVTVRNKRTGRALTLRSVSTSAPFAVAPLTAPIVIAPSSSIVVYVTFTPPSAGAFSGSLRCVFASGAERAYTLSGTGVEPPAPPGTYAMTLAWDANSEPDLDGYLVYMRAGATAYGAPVATVASPTYRFSGLTAGSYTFRVTAIDTNGLESPPSNEVSRSFP